MALTSYVNSLTTVTDSLPVCTALLVDFCFVHRSIFVSAISIMSILGTTWITGLFVLENPYYYYNNPVIWTFVISSYLQVCFT